MNGLATADPKAKSAMTQPDGKKKNAWLFIRIVVTVAVLAFLGWKMRGELAEFGHTVANANFPWMLGAYLSFAIVIGCAVLRWQLLLKAQSLVVKVVPLIEYFMIGLFFNNFMLGATGGDFVKAYYVSKETHHKKTEAMTTVFIDRIVGMFAIIVIALIALLFHMNDPKMRKVTTAIFICFGVFVGFALLFLNKKLVRKIPFFDAIQRRLPFREQLARVYDAFYVYHDHKGVIARAFAYSLFLQFVMILIIWGLGKALDIQGVYLIHYMLLVPVISTVSALPISFGGLGLGEGAYVYFFNLVTEQTAKYLALALTLRFLTILWSLVGGLFLLLPKTRIPAGELEEAKTAS